MSKHYLVFVHGIGERETEKPSRQGHIDADCSVIKSYTILWDNLSRAFQRQTQCEFSEHFAPVYTDWHTEQIHRAEKAIHNAAFPDLASRKLSLIKPLRNFATFFLGDVTAYVSKDVNVIRRTVWSQIWDQLQRPLKEEGATYSIIAHSLGTVIMFDYLADLLQNDKLFVADLNPGMTVSADDRQLLRERFQHFVTLGSPVGLFMLREGGLWANGTPFSTIHNPVCGTGRNWLNFYDRKDIIAYPLENIFKTNTCRSQDYFLEDIAVWSGWTPFSAHTQYWQHQGIADRIAKTLNQVKPMPAPVSVSNGVPAIA